MMWLNLKKFKTLINPKQRHLTEFNIKNNDSRTFKGKCKNCQSQIKFKLNNKPNGANKGLVERDSISFQINGVQYTGSLIFN